jgi:hypothetical protein
MHLASLEPLQPKIDRGEEITGSIIFDQLVSLIIRAGMIFVE